MAMRSVANQNGALGLCNPGLQWITPDQFIVHQTLFGCHIYYIVPNLRESRLIQIMMDVFFSPADGPRSLARSQLLHLPDGGVNSGYAIFRAYFDVPDRFKGYPSLQDFITEDEDVVRFWVGRDMHGFIYTWNKGRCVANSSVIRQ